MRRRRATHMQAVEEEVERLSQENSLLLHRMSQLVASHQAVDAENAQLRADLMTLRHSVVRRLASSVIFDSSMI
jgi:cell shape-determining protein MreC